MHQHHNEQVTYILDGALTFAIDGKETFACGSDLHFRPNMPHRSLGAEDTLEPGRLPIFSREDWLNNGQTAIEPRPLTTVCCGLFLNGNG